MHIGIDLGNTRAEAIVRLATEEICLFATVCPLRAVYYCGKSGLPLTTRASARQALKGNEIIRLAQAQNRGAELWPYNMVPARVKHFESGSGRKTPIRKAAYGDYSGVRGAAD